MWPLREHVAKRAAVLFVCLPLLGGAVSNDVDLAAQVDGKHILLHEVDELSQLKVDRIRTRLVGVARTGLERLVDRELGVEEPIVSLMQVAPISDAEIDTFRRERATDFKQLFAPGAIPPDAEREAIRFHLQSESRKAAEVRLQVERRAQHHIEILFPEARELEIQLSHDRVVARIDDRVILAAALEREMALRLYRVRGELYLERRRNLKALIEQRLLVAEAQRRGISPEAFEKALRRPVPVSDTELATFVAERRAAGQPVENPERVRSYLAFKKAYQHRADLLARLRTSASVRVYLEPPTRPRLEMDTTGGVSLGTGVGSRLIVFTNYRCRSCRATHRELDRLRSRERSPEVVLRDFVPVYDPAATEAAALARCAARHGALARMRAALLQQDPPAFGHPWFSREEFDALAHSAGMNPDTLRRCTQSADVKHRIEQDTEAARRLGFDSAPAFVAEGLPLSGMQSAEGLGRALEGARAARR